MTYAVVARYECAAEHIETVRAALLAMREHTTQEPANTAYVVHAEIDNDGVFVLYEQYADRAGFEAHANSPHFAELITATVRPLLRNRTVAFATVL